MPPQAQRRGFQATDGAFQGARWASESTPNTPPRDSKSVDVSAASISDASAAQLAMKVQIAVLKQSMDIQSQSALALLEAVPSPVSSNPPNLGNTIDVMA